MLVRPTHVSLAAAYRRAMHSDASDATEKRAEDVVKLRKAKREQQLKRVRRQAADSAGNALVGPPPVFNAESARQIMIGLQTGNAENRSCNGFVVHFRRRTHTGVSQRHCGRCDS